MTHKVGWVVCLALCLGGAARGADHPLQVHPWLEGVASFDGQGALYGVARCELPGPFDGWLEVVDNDAVIFRRAVHSTDTTPAFWFEAPPAERSYYYRSSVRLTDRHGECQAVSALDSRYAFAPVAPGGLIGRAAGDAGAEAALGRHGQAGPPGGPDSGPFVVAFDAAQAPASSAGWSPLSAVVWSSRGAEAYSPEALAALGTWLRQGGRLIIVGGSEKLHGHPWVAPIDPVRVTDYTVYPNGNTFAGYAYRPGAHALGDIVERPLGLGAVDFVADASRLATAWDMLLPAKRIERDQPQMDRERLPHASFALLRAPAPRGRWLLVGLLGYVLLLGPLLFGLVARRERWQTAWVALPALAVVCTAAAYFASLALRPGHALERTISLVDVAAGQHIGVAETITALSAPRPTTFEVSLPHGMALLGSRVALDSHQPPLITATEADARTATVAVGQGSVRRLRYRQDAEVGPVDMDLEVGSDGGHGTVTNRGDETLCGAVLCLGSQRSGAYVPVGDLEPGESQAVRWSADAKDTPALCTDYDFVSRTGLRRDKDGGPSWPSSFYAPTEHFATLLAWTDEAGQEPAVKPEVRDARAIRILRVHGEARLAPGRVTLHPQLWFLQSSDGNSVFSAVLPGVADGARCTALDLTLQDATSGHVSVWDWTKRVWIPWEAGMASQDPGRFVDPAGHVRVRPIPGKPAVTVTATLEH